jgi:hypothetical protein
MGNPGNSKRQLEKNRREKAEAKRERRRSRAGDRSDDTIDADGRSQQQLLAQLAALHERQAEGALTPEELEALKNDLVSHIRLD